MRLIRAGVFRQPAPADASTNHALTVPGALTDAAVSTEVKTALDALGTKINQLLQELRDAGVLS